MSLCRVGFCVCTDSERETGSRPMLLYSTESKKRAKQKAADNVVVYSRLFCFWFLSTISFLT